MVEYKDSKLYYDVTLDLECERATPIIRTTGGLQEKRYLRLVVTANGEKIKFDNVIGATFYWISSQGKFWMSKTTTWENITEGNEEYTQFIASFEADTLGADWWQGRAMGWLRINDNYTSIETQIMYIDHESYYQRKPDVDPTIVYGYNEIQTNAITDEVREEEI